MPTKLPRLNVVLDAVLNESLAKLAKRDGVSKSLKARDLIREALETYEDQYWHQKAEERAKTYDVGKSLTVEEMKARLKKKSRK